MKKTQVNSTDPEIDDAVARSKVLRFTQFIKLANSVVGLLTWPLVVILILILFYTPIRRVVELLPDKFEKSHELSFGSLSFKIQEQARAVGNEELANIISGLSEEAIQWVLKLGTGSHRIIGSKEDLSRTTTDYMLPSHFAAWKELETKGLLKSSMNLTEYEQFFRSLGPTNGNVAKAKLTNEQEDRLVKASVELSSTGRRAYEIIIRVVADLIKQ